MCWSPIDPVFQVPVQLFLSQERTRELYIILDSARFYSRSGLLLTKSNTKICHGKEYCRGNHSWQDPFLPPEPHDREGTMRTSGNPRNGPTDLISSGIGIRITPKRIREQQSTTTLLYLLLCIVIVLNSLLVISEQASAWSDDPTVNTPICTASGSQYNPQITSDGSGGAIITWEDNREGDSYTEDIYAQKIDQDGTLGEEDFPWLLFYPAILKKK
jgi:hypothetical protein